VRVAPLIHVGTSGGLVRLADEGTIDFEGSVVNSIARDDGRWWAIVDGHVIVAGRPGAWANVARVQDHRLNCLLARGAAGFVGTSKARLARVDLGGEWEFVTAFDALDGRDEWYTPWGGPPDVRSLARDDEGALFVNVHVGGILRSDDGGNSFVPTIDIHSDVHEVVCTNGLVLAATAHGLASSSDSGQTWSFQADGLHASYCRAVAVAGSNILLSASVGPHGGRAGLYRRPLVGGRLERCETGLPEWFGDNIDTGCVAASGPQAAFATSDGRVFLSDDDGATWEQVAAGLQPARKVVILSD
jgi:hypothetical protein